MDASLIISVLLVGSLHATAYRSVPSQTDNSPWITSIGERVNSHGVAVSQDLLKQNGGPIDYDDEIYIEGIGFKVVNDCMNIRHHKSIDVWVSTHREEKEFFKRHKNKAVKVWVIHPIQKGN